MSKITVELSNDDGSEEVTFPVVDLLAYHGEARSWQELATADPHLQMSLAEDYALHHFKRRHGDEGEYRVDVLSGLTDDAEAASSAHTPSA